MMNFRDKYNKEMNSKEWIKYISSQEFTQDELCWLYCCGFIWRRLLIDIENLPAVTKAVLDKGLDPNHLVTEEPPSEVPEDNYYESPMICATRIKDDAAAAASLKLLLEHGGDPNTVHDFESPRENILEFYVEDEFVHGPDLPGAVFYGLLLCAAYGGKYKNGYSPFTMLIDMPISVFKDYNSYWYEYEESGDYDITLYVIEKETGRRVARYH